MESVPGTQEWLNIHKSVRSTTLTKWTKQDWPCVVNCWSWEMSFSPHLCNLKLSTNKRKGKREREKKKVKDPSASGFLETYAQAKLILINSQPVEEPTHSLWITEEETSVGLFGEPSYSPKDMTFNHDKRSFVCVRNVFLHVDSSALAEKAGLGSRQVLSPPVPPFCPTGHPAQSGLAWFTALCLDLTVKALLFSQSSF